MSDIKARLKKLNETIPPEKSDRKTVVLIYGESKPTEDVDVIWVNTPEGKRTTECIIGGERME